MGDGESASLQGVEMEGNEAGFRVEPSNVLALLGLAISFCVLAGWALGVTELKAVLPGLRATQPLEALVIALSALALLTTPRRSSAGSSALSSAIGLVVLAVTAFIVIQNVVDGDWGSDRLLFPGAVLAEQTGPYLRAGRPAGSLLIANVLIVTALLNTQARHPRRQRLFVYASTIGLLGSLSVIFAYAFSVPSLQALGLYARVGLLAAVANSLIFVGLLMRRREFGWVQQLCGTSIGAITSRHLLVWTAAVLLVSAVVVHAGAVAQWYRAEVAVAIVALSGFSVLFAAVLSYGRRMDALAAQLAQTQQTLKHSRDREEQAEAALQLLELRKQAFLADLGHELRNPLAPVSTSIALLRLRLEQDNVTDSALFLIDRQTRKLAQAIDKAIADCQKTVLQPGDMGWRHESELDAPRHLQQGERGLT